MIMLKDLQLGMIVGIVTGYDVFAILPTGYGKSLCYGCCHQFLMHCTSPLSHYIVAVVTPLTSIIEDQVTI